MVVISSPYCYRSYDFVHASLLAGKNELHRRYVIKEVHSKSYIVYIRVNFINDKILSKKGFPSILDSNSTSGKTNSFPVPSPYSADNCYFYGCFMFILQACHILCLMHWKFCKPFNL